jgi:hypothetical protein
MGNSDVIEPGNGLTVNRPPISVQRVATTSAQIISKELSDRPRTSHSISQ